MILPTSHQVRRLAAAALTSFTLCSPALAQEASPASAPEEENSGQDPTRPVTRFDIRLKYQSSPDGHESQLLTLRADKPFELKDGWKLSTRVDAPIVRSNAMTPQNVDADYNTGLGDMLLQALLITPPDGKFTFAFGTQVIVPTGSDDQFTTGKWRLVPSAAAIYQLPELSRGSFVGVVLRDDFSFAGDDGRAEINVVSLQPIFNWALPDRWFITASPEAKFNAEDGWTVFLPFDITVGKKINPTTVLSVQADVALIDDYEQYDWQVELRLGVFF
jgi:hypothetical protein